MHILLIMLGVVLLTLGRELFWCFVGIAGFLAGLEFTAFLLPDQPLWVQFLAGAGLGLAGIVVAILAQRVGFALAGFYAGAYLLFSVCRFYDIGSVSVVGPVIGGVIGAVVAALIMDWALIMLSSLAGAGAIVVALGLEEAIGALIFVLITVAGIAVQRLQMQQRRKD